MATVAERFARAAAWRSRDATPPSTPQRPAPPAKRPAPPPHQDAPKAPAVRIVPPAPIPAPAGLNAEGAYTFFERLGIGDDLGMRPEDALAIATEEAWSAHHAEERRRNAHPLHALAALAAELFPGAEVTRRRGPRDAGGIDAGEILDRIAQANAKESPS